MSCLMELASQWKEGPDQSLWNDWSDAVRSCIEGMPDRDPGSLDREKAWTIAGWAEKAASQSVRVRDTRLVATGLSGIAIISESDVLDLRDLLVVAGLLRRAAKLLGADRSSIVDISRSLPCIGSRDNSVLDWFASDVSTRNLGHEEVGEGSNFEFKRVPLADVERIQRMREAGGPAD